MAASLDCRCGRASTWGTPARRRKPRAGCASAPVCASGRRHVKSLGRQRRVLYCTHTIGNIDRMPPCGRDSMTQPPQTASRQSQVDWASISAENLARLWEHSARAMGKRYVRWPGAWAADAGAPSPFPNSATLVRPLEESGVASLTSQLAEFYAADQGGPWLLWSAWPTPDLTAHGFQRLGASAADGAPGGWHVARAPGGVADCRGDGRRAIARLRACGCLRIPGA